MKKQKLMALALTTSLTTALLAYGTAAEAGFVLQGSAQGAAKTDKFIPLKADPAALTPPDADMVDMGPVIDNAPQTPVEAAPVESAAVEAAPVEAAPIESIAGAPAAPAVVANDLDTATLGDVIEGFGSDMNIVMALREIVPAQYQISFVRGVDPAARISWQGGKPWRLVADEALAPGGLGLEMQGNVAVVGPRRAPAEMAAPAPARSDFGPALVTTDAPVLEMREVPVEAPADDIVWSAPAPAPAADVAPLPPMVDGSAPMALLDGKGGGLTPMPAPVMAEKIDAPVAEVIKLGAGHDALAAQMWSAPEGYLLRDVLKDWSDRAGVDLYWSVDYDYRLNRAQSFTGTYEEAVAGLLDQFSAIKPQPFGQLHRGAEGPQVLVVKIYDSQ